MFRKYIILWLLRSSPIRPNFDTEGSKSGRNFDQTSTPPVSKFGRSLVEGWCCSLVDILSNVPYISLMYRANFDQTSTPTSFNIDYVYPNK